MVCEAHFAWPRHRAATDDRRRTRRVMWCAKRSLSNKSRSARHGTDRRVNARDFEGFIWREWRKNRRQCARHHGLAASSRTDQKHVVSAGSCKRERPLRRLLAAYFSEVERGAERRRAFGGRLLAWKVVEPVDEPERLAEIANPIDLKSFDRGRFRRILKRNNDASQSLRTREGRETCGSANRSQGAIECEFTREAKLCEQRIGALADDTEHAKKCDGDRQVVDRPFFAEIRGCKVNGASTSWSWKIEIAKGRTDAMRRLAHRRVGKSDDGDSRR